MTKRKHQFAGDHEATQVVTWLNSGSSDGRRRIAEMIELYKKLGESVPQVWRPGEKKIGPKWTLSKERGEMNRRLQELLDRYSYKFIFMSDRHLLAPAVPVTGDDLYEFHAVPRVHMLRTMGVLSRVRRCDGCGVWMFAKVPGKRFHAEACRVKANQSDRAWRERNNEKRRKKYWQEKQRGAL